MSRAAGSGRVEGDTTRKEHEMSNATEKRRLRALGVILTLATTVAVVVGATAKSAQAQRRDA